jgi:uncharacterized protein
VSAALPTPTPRRTPENEEFWAATAEHRLLLRRCDDCGNPIWYPRSFCPDCGTFNTSWSEASGRGTVYAFTIVYRSNIDGYRQALPYVVAYVELAEGPRIMTNVVGCEPDAVHVGMPVRVVFHDTGEGSALYRFEPAGSD